MKSSEKQYQDFVKHAQPLCSEACVRTDENGTHIFAMGLGGAYTIDLRKIDDRFVVELWYGDMAEDEKIMGKPAYAKIEEAFAAAEAWLAKDKM